MRAIDIFQVLVKASQTRFQRRYRRSRLLPFPPAVQFRSTSVKPITSSIGYALLTPLRTYKASEALLEATVRCCESRTLPHHPTHSFRSALEFGGRQRNPFEKPTFQPT